MESHRFGIAEITLIPTGGGVFEVTVNGKLVFSKKELGRFPEQGEVPKLLNEQGVPAQV